MKDIWSYPVTFVYGYSAAYGPTFHTGQDRTAPIGTPVTVNGVLIGYSGNTGLSTGPHCHIGKWQGSQSYDPAGGGATFQSAVVTEIHPTNTDNNGKYVRVQGDGYSWVYLHLNDVSNIKVGQELKEEDMTFWDSVISTQEEERQVFLAWCGRNPYPQEIGRYVGKEVSDVWPDIAKNQTRKTIDPVFQYMNDHNGELPNPAAPTVVVNGVDYVPK